MVNSTLTDPKPNFTLKAETPSLTSFFQNSPTGYALYDHETSEIIYSNDALIRLFQCDSQALKSRFPSPEPLRIKNPEFSLQWRRQLLLLNQNGHTSTEWTILSRYGEKRVLKVELWKMDAPHQHLSGIKVEDVTSLRKMAQESRSFVKII